MAKMERESEERRNPSRTLVRKGKVTAAAFLRE